MALSLYKDKSYRQKTQPNDVVAIVDELLAKAVDAGASDIHFEPAGSELVVKFRLDGVLNAVETLPKSISDNIIARLKVLGGLLTYRNDIPQEGRIEVDSGRADVVDRRLAVFPTIHGQRAVVRIFYQNTQLADIERLGFSAAIRGTRKQNPCVNPGVLLVRGAA